MILVDENSMEFLKYSDTETKYILQLSQRILWALRERPEPGAPEQFW